MNKNLLYIFLFGFGLICGFWLSQHFGGLEKSPNTGASSKPISGANRSATPTIREATSTILVEHILPNTSPVWLWVDIKKMRDQGKTFSALWEKESISTLMNEFVSSLPQGVTPTLIELWNHSEQLRLFMMPPSKENNRPTYAAAFLEPKRKPDEAVRSLTQPLLAAYPESPSSEEKIGPLKIQAFSTPIGEFGVFFDSDTLWICTPKTALAPLWSSPPSAELLDKPGPQVEAFKRFPDAVMGLFLNESESGMAAMATPGFFPRFLTAAGIRHAACLYRLQDKSAQLTFYAPAKTPPLWTKNWKPLDQFPFTTSDPVGLMEIAFQVPDFAIPLSATGEVQSASQTGPTLVSMDPNSPNSDSPVMVNSMPEMINNRPQSSPMRMEGSSAPPIEENRGERPDRNRSSVPLRKEPGNDHSGSENRLAFYRFLSRFLPPGSTVGLNLFGFQDGNPSLALLLADSQAGNSFMENLQKLSAVQPSDIEIAKIPGKEFQFGDKPIADQFDLQALIALERDAVTYLFDEKEAAKNYLGEINSDPQGKNRRSPDLRKLVDQITTPSHIKGVISKDFFAQILEVEKARLPQDDAHFEEFSTVVEDLRSFVQPMTIHGGFNEGEWFLEAQVSSPPSHAVDTLLFGYAAYRLLGF